MGMPIVVCSPTCRLVSSCLNLDGFHRHCHHLLHSVDPLDQVFFVPLTSESLVKLSLLKQFLPEPVIQRLAFPFPVDRFC